jgi:DNA-binding transcriptional regulator YdaS (Cro superfamily)
MHERPSYEKRQTNYCLTFNQKFDNLRRMNAKARKALRRAIDIAGGQEALADALGVRQSHISYWLRKSKTGVPAERVRDVERVTGIAPHELRPDLFVQPVDRAVQGFGEDGVAFDDNAASASERSPDHFSRFKHLRRALFSSKEEVEDHVRALRDEWDRR